jgi:phosphoglycolate phosphatase
MNNMDKSTKRYDIILFDLDGTLTNPKEGITKSVAYALSHFGIYVNDLDELCKFIGPSLEFSFRKYYGLEGADNALAIQKYREIFSREGIWQNAEYPGMKELLEKLYKAGKRLIVATAKPTVYAEKIIEHFGMAKFFEKVAGSELNGQRSEKDEVIAHAMKECGIASPEGCVMVGDREYDIWGAKNNNMDSVGVLYGFGTREELEAAGATYIAKDIDELAEILSGE